MSRERPAPVSVLAVASLLVGGVAAVVGTACALATGLEASLTWFDGLPGGRSPRAYLHAHAWSYAAYETLRPTTTALLGVGLLISGWGLWRRWRGAARGAAILSVVALVSTGGALFYEIAFVLPTLEAFQNARADRYQPTYDYSNVWLAPAVQLTVGLLLIVLACATLVTLASPAATEDSESAGPTSK